MLNNRRNVQLGISAGMIVSNAHGVLLRGDDAKARDEWRDISSESSVPPIQGRIQKETNSEYMRSLEVEPSEISSYASTQSSETNRDKKEYLRNMHQESECSSKAGSISTFDSDPSSVTGTESNDLSESETASQLTGNTGRQMGQIVSLDLENIEPVSYTGDSLLVAAEFADAAAVKRILDLYQDCKLTVDVVEVQAATGYPEDGVIGFDLSDDNCIVSVASGKWADKNTNLADYVGSYCITKVNDTEVSNIKELAAFKAGLKPGDPLLFTLSKRIVDGDVNQVDSHGKTALHIASEQGFTDVAEQILSHSGILVNMLDSRSQSALSLACENNHSEVVRLLLEHPEIDGLGVHCALGNRSSHGVGNECSVIMDLLLGYSGIDVNYSTPLIGACQTSNVECVHKLLGQTKIQVNKASSENGTTPLIMACVHGNAEIFNKFIQRADIEVNKADPDGYTPLYMACQHGHLEIVRTLLGQHGIKVSTASTDTGITPLYVACQEGHLEIVQTLLQEDEIDVNQAKNNGCTPLAIASEKGYIKIVQAFLEQTEIEADKADSRGQTPFYVACAEGKLGVVNLFLQKTVVDVDCTIDNGATPLAVACMQGNPEIVNRLLELSAVGVNKQLDDGTTPLCMACQQGYLGIVQNLLEQNEVDVNKAKIDGATPLYHACRVGHLLVVIALLRRNEIDVNAAKNDGWTPFLIASHQGWLEIVQKLLEQKEIKVNQPNNNGCTALYIACKNGHLEIVNMLLQRNEIELNKAELERGVTPLFVACQFGNSEVVQKLLEQNDIQVNKAAEGGMTPLIISCQEGCLDIVEQLLQRNEIKVNQVVGGRQYTALVVASLSGHLEIVIKLLEHPRTDFATSGKFAISNASSRGQVHVVEFLLAYSNNFWKEFEALQSNAPECPTCGKSTMFSLYRMVPNSTQASFWACDFCPSTDKPFPPNIPGYTCAKCDHDCCMNCAEKRSSASNTTRMGTNDSSVHDESKIIFAQLYPFKRPTKINSHTIQTILPVHDNVVNDEDADLAKALALSTQDISQNDCNSDVNTVNDEDDDLAKALALSMQDMEDQSALVSSSVSLTDSK